MLHFRTAQSGQTKDNKMVFSASLLNRQHEEFRANATFTVFGLTPKEQFSSYVMVKTSNIH
jgi:hypothetical protein